MILDGIALSLITYEINEELIPSKIVDLLQIEQYGILFDLKNKRGSQKLFFSLRPDRMTFFISEMMAQEDLHSSTFLKQLKIQLQGGKLVNIEQVEFDRIIKLYIEPYQKFGTPLNYILIIEFMGKHSNAILVDANGYIKTALKQFGSELNRYREIKPGILYKSPPRQDKLNLFAISKEQFIDMVQNTGSSSPTEYLWYFLHHNFQGLSTKSAKEIVVFANFPTDFRLFQLNSEKLIMLWEKLCNLKERIAKHNVKPLLLIDKKSGRAIDYSLLSPASNKEVKYLSFARVSTCLEFFYHQTAEEGKKERLYRAISRTLQKTRDKLEEKKNFLEKRDKEIKDCEQYRKKGELIIANLWNLESGIDMVTLIDYTLPENPELEIELNPNLSPLQNARQFFQRYRKLAPNRETNKRQLLENQESLRKLKEMFLTLSENKDSLPELTTLYQKLIQLNYIKRKKDNRSRNVAGRTPSLQRFLSIDGWTVLLGKSNLQNEYLLRHLSNGNDFWLHHQTRPGAHVLIKNHQNLPVPPPDTLNFAARLAGYYSKVKNNEIAQIVYTLRKYVKKPKDSKAGKVIYSQEKNIAILINHEQIKKEINQMMVV